MPFPRCPKRGSGWLRTERGRCNAKRVGTATLAEAGTRMVAGRPGRLVPIACGHHSRWPRSRKKMLTRWQVEPHLAGLRDADALNKLVAAEREEFLALWREV